MRTVLPFLTLGAAGIAACLFPSLDDFAGGDASPNDANPNDALLDGDLTCLDAGDPSLEVWFRMDEGSGTTTKDCSGHGRDGTFVSGGAANWSPGKHGNALHVVLADSTGCVSVAGFPELTTFTVAAWINVTSLPTQNSAFVIDKTLNVNAEGWRVGPSSTNNWVFGVGNDSGATNVTSGASVALGSWTHVAATYDPSVPNMAIYLNGTIDLAKQAPIFIPSQGTLHIGCRADNSQVAAHYDGLVDEVRIYSRILAPTEISALAN